MSEMVRCGLPGKYFYVPEPQYSKTEIDNMLWAAYQRQRHAPVEQPYVSVYPICAPSGYPLPMNFDNTHLSLAELPQPVEGRVCPHAVRPAYLPKLKRRVSRL